MANEKLCEFNVLNEDITKLLAGLKAVQRETRKTIKTLKELENVNKEAVINIE